MGAVRTRPPLPARTYRPPTGHRQQTGQPRLILISDGAPTDFEGHPTEDWRLPERLAPIGGTSGGHRAGPAVRVRRPRRQRRRDAGARHRPGYFRLTASVVAHAADVIAAGFDEACRRDPRHARTWVALVDGTGIRST